jgi:hypothetical protein
MHCNCSDIAMQSSERSEPKYDRDFLLSPGKRNELLELWEVEKFGRDCFDDPDHVHLYGMTPTTIRGTCSQLRHCAAVDSAICIEN